MALPLVAVVGRPNVGKSTLVNRLAAVHEAIVDPLAGVTRDRNYVSTEWNGKVFTLIDTGGLEVGTAEPLATAIAQQAFVATEEADVIIFLVDGKDGVLPGDSDISEVLRRGGKTTLLVVNKIDDPRKELERLAPFFELGLGAPMGISAMHGGGTGDLLDEVVHKLAAAPEGLEGGEVSEAKELCVAIVGKPNVGKSSLVNKLVGAQRAIVSEAAGTTRDAVDTVIGYKEARIRLIDTAGLRRRAKVEESLEYYSLVRALRVLDRADVAVLVVDADTGVGDQDQKVADMALSRGCAIVVAVNKWDLVEGEEGAEGVLGELGRKMQFVSYAPVARISALTGRGVAKLMEMVLAVAEEYHRRVSTPKLNVFAADIEARGLAPSLRGKRLKTYYMTQVRTGPPGFAIFVNEPKLVNVNYRRYLENRLREAFGFEGTPLSLWFRPRK